MNICKKCNTAYPKVLLNCPVCGQIKSFDLKKIFLVLFFFCITIGFLIETTDVIGKIEDSFRPRKRTQYIKVKKAEINKSSGIVNVPVHPMSEFSGLSKDEIFEHRKKAVSRSIVFSNIKNYSPNPDVYRVADGLPWISAYETAKYGTRHSKDIGKGNSRSSILTNNPELLVGFIIPEFISTLEEAQMYEPDEIDYLIPKKITWDKENKTIRAYFDIKKFLKKRRRSDIELYPDETNARDFGYNWIYCDKNMGASFLEKNNISKKPYKMLGYYHRGYACRVEGGCNNYSPYQSYLYFKAFRKNSYLRFKLWKEKPFSPLQRADMYYEMWLE